jgi:HAD superfamily hydrolase (TIGR01509 family)
MAIKKIKVKVLAFDLMGVIYGHGHINREYSLDFLKFPASRYSLVSRLYKRYKVGQITKEEFWHNLGKSSLVEGKFLQKIKRSINKDFFTIIKKLDPNYQIVAVSDMPLSWAIGLLDINKNFTFDYSIISAWTGKKKDRSVVNFKELLKRMRVRGSEVLFIDDLLVNLKNAAKLGIRTVWFPQDFKRPEQKVRYRPDYQIKKLTDIIKIVK